MALRNGLLVHGPTHWAAAVRGRDGEIELASERKPELAPKLVAKAPGLRGPVKLAEAMAVLPLVRRRLPAARLPFEDWRVVAAVGATLGASALLRRQVRPSARREGIAQALGAVPAVVALMDRDLAAYHGVEHKAIAAYEQGIDDPATVPKEHDRCGSNLIVPMMLLSAGGTLLLERLVDRPGSAARGVVGLAGASAAVEMFAWSDRHHGEPLAEAFHTPGREIQRHWATKEPTPEQLEVGIAALAEILRVEPAPASANGDAAAGRIDWPPCSEGSTTSESPSRTSTRRSGSTSGASRWSWRIARRSSPRASRRSCSTSATDTSSCWRRSAPTPPSASSSPARAPACTTSPTRSTTSTRRCRGSRRRHRADRPEPRVGIRESRVAFLHPRSTGGVLTEIVEPAGGH